MKTKPYNRPAAVAYARKWALQRNPAYISLNGIGGDCTNFVSQCLYAGCGVMNETKDVGWYYHTADDRAAAWTGVPYFHRFLIQNKGIGPAAVEQPLEALLLGDFILLHNGERFYHSLIVAGFYERTILVCAHSDDALMRPLSTYHALRMQGLHIDTVRQW